MKVPQPRQYATKPAKEPFSMTIAYRESDDYKMRVAAIRENCPDLPQHFVDNIIFLQKNNPNIQREYMALERKLKNAGVATNVEGDKPRQLEECVIRGAVSIEDPVELNFC